MRIRPCLIKGLLSLLAIFVAGHGATAISADVSLDWEPSASRNIAGYNIYAGKNPRLYSDPIFVGNRTTYTVSGLSNGTWYFAITSLYRDGIESDFSNEVSYLIGVPDQMPPTIREVYVRNITATGASIEWTTNESANSQIEYGLTTDYGDRTPLLNRMIAGHSRNLAGLRSGTLYHYRIQSTDAAGNLAVSGDYSFMTGVAVRDATPPIISRLSSSDITSTSALITWITNEIADTQVDYGTTAAYGSNTSPRVSRVTSHTEALRDLTADTLYHYRVRSRDAAGNLALSEDHTFTTPAKGDAPIISGIEISELTERSALISWFTDKAADSRVEHWEIGKAVRKSALGSFVTRHSIRLNNLKKGTLHSFRIKAVDPDNLQSVSSEYAFKTPAEGNRVATIPRFADRQVAVEAGDEVAIGIALTNAGSDHADIMFSAVDSNGALMDGPDIVNPRFYELNPQGQQAMLDVEIFGFGLEPHGTKGWIKMESSAPDPDGFFLIFDSKLSFMDGTNLGNAPLTDFVFAEIKPEASTQISIINDNDRETEVLFELMTADGSVRQSESRTIEGNGALVSDLFRDLFYGMEPDAEDYVRAHATQKVQPFEKMQREKGDIAILAGQDRSEGGTILYSPQFIFGASMRTTLSIINLDSKSGNVEIQFRRDDGVQSGTTRVLQIPANGKLHMDASDFWGAVDPGELLSGYVKVESDGMRLTGSTVFGSDDGRSYTAALPLISNLQDSVLFSHVVSNDLLYTELAIANPGAVAAAAVLQLYSADGRLLDHTRIQIPAGQRAMKALTDLFPYLVGKDQTNGYIRLISNTPLAAIALLSTTDMSVLSAIPPGLIQ